MFNDDYEEGYEAGYDEGYDWGNELGYEEGIDEPQDHPHKKSEGCYVATCVYGSYDCPEVWTLRRFRDQKLKGFALGRLFIRVYYTLSPGLVARFGRDPWFRSPILHLLNPFVAFLHRRGYSDQPYRDQESVHSETMEEKE